MRGCGRSSVSIPLGATKRGSVCGFWKLPRRSRRWRRACGSLAPGRATLPEKHRQVIHLRFYADASLEEIAAALGCAIGTVKSRLHHGLEKLRRSQVNLSPTARDSIFEDPV